MLLSEQKLIHYFTVLLKTVLRVNFSFFHCGVSASLNG